MHSPHAWEIDLPGGVDLVVLFHDDPAARVHWVADTRKVWLDERPRFEAAQPTPLPMPSGR